jgi:hypothetical protein
MIVDFVQQTLTANTNERLSTHKDKRTKTHILQMNPIDLQITLSAKFINR